MLPSITVAVIILVLFLQWRPTERYCSLGFPITCPALHKAVCIQNGDNLLAASHMYMNVKAYCSCVCMPAFLPACLPVHPTVHLCMHVCMCRGAAYTCIHGSRSVCAHVGCVCFSVIVIILRLKCEDDLPPDQASCETPIQEHYCDDPQLSIYSRVTCSYAVGPHINLLMASEVNHTPLCSVRPHGVPENATFVINLEEVCFSDLWIDDLGSWKATGIKSTWFRLTSEGVRILGKKPSDSELHRYYVLMQW